MDYNQASQAIYYSIGIMATEDKPALVNMLKRSGSMATELSTTDELLDASYKALKDSKIFRADLAQYLTSSVNETEEDASFSNAPGGKERRKAKREARQGKTAVGNFLSNIFSKENLDKIIAGGISFGSTKLTNKAAEKGNQQAIDYEKAQTEKFLAQAQAGNLPDTGGKKNKWVLPVAVGGGLLVVGLIIYFVIRNRKNA